MTGTSPRLLDDEAYEAVLGREEEEVVCEDTEGGESRTG